MAEYRSSLRSKKLIRNAFAELVEEKGEINKITVKEIIDRADISKSTFYAHYMDIYAVIEEFENEVLDALNQSIDEYMKDKGNAFMPYINRLLNLLKTNENLYHKLFKLESEVKFIDKLKLQVFNKIESFLVEELRGIPEKKLIFYLDFIGNGIAYLIVDYFTDKIDLTLDEIAKEVDFMLTSLVNLTKEVQKNKR